MIHSYRDPEALKRTFWGPNLGGFGVLALLVVVLSFVWSQLTWSDAQGLGLFVGCLFLFVPFAYRHHYYGTCEEIRLSDDGTCEPDTKRRTIRLHVNQIRSVVYGRGRSSEGDGEFYSIRYEGGKLYVDERMTDFRDFLDRLRTLNPAVDLSTFPADAWPGLATSADARAAALRRGVRGALFPASVVILLIWLAVETLR